MDLAKRAEKINAGIKAQETIKSRCEKDGDSLGAKRAQKKINEYKRELNNLGRQI
ncbi:hypothetical protein SEA_MEGANTHEEKILLA_10 [Streptomyces phage MeganTheeKilla]|uniref:Uncharacterized protein n=1 Tax=Streptomyces phage MeganTheeKilla TaxID=2801897 RepID=A0A7U0J5L9_9CAUD|nr:hypothetical protein SEA_MEGANTHEEKILLA_10 [Streptomyces phage MeganTheeKilla]